MRLTFFLLLFIIFVGWLGKAGAFAKGTMIDVVVTVGLFVAFCFLMPIFADREF